MIVIVLIAVGWHLGILGITQFIESKRTSPSLKRLLHLIELELLQNLHEALRTLPSEKLRNPPYQTRLKETEYWLGRLEESHE